MSGNRAGGHIARTPVDFTRPSNGQVLKYNSAEGKAEWGVDAGGVDAQEGASGAGVSVVNPATKLNVDSITFDFAAPGGGEAFLTFKPDTDTNNTFVGYLAGRSRTTGVRNAFYGEGAGKDITTASDNTLVGYQAGFKNNPGGSNTYVGTQAG